MLRIRFQYSFFTFYTLALFGALILLGIVILSVCTDGLAGILLSPFGLVVGLSFLFVYIKIGLNLLVSIVFMTIISDTIKMKYI